MGSGVSDDKKMCSKTSTALLVISGKRHHRSYLYEIDSLEIAQLRFSFHLYFVSLETLRV